jgi:hypothetical protein
MRIHSASTPRIDLTVRFVGSSPCEDTVRLAHRLATERALAGPLTVIIEATRDEGDGSHAVRVMAPSIGHWGHAVRGDLREAVHAAFDNLEQQRWALRQIS